MLLPLPKLACSQVDVEVRCAVGSEYFVSFEVQGGSVIWSRALFVSRLRTAIVLLIPDSASENALCRDRLCAVSFAPEVEYAIAVVPAISITAVIPTAITSAIPRSLDNRRRSRRRMRV